MNLKWKPHLHRKPEDEMMEKEEKREITKLITDLIHQLIEQSPKHGFAALLLINNIKGKDAPWT